MATTSDKTIFSRDDLDLIVAFAGCSLDEKPGSNFVQDNGGLPDYICRIAKAIKRTGRPTSQAIAIALSRTRKWAAGADDVDADTRAKSAKAIAEWDALRARSKAKTAAKKTVKASHSQGEILMLSDKVNVFNVDTVRQAWENQSQAWRSKWRTQNPQADYSEGPGHSYVSEMWTDHLIVKSDGDKLFWVDYSVDADGQVVFGEEKEVKTQYVVVEPGEMVGEGMSTSDLRQLMASVGPCHPSATDQVLLSIRQRPSALETVLAARRSSKE